jgi:DNA-binding MarR family transcriptional regulator
VAGVALLAAFVFVETRATEPILPLEIFRNRVFTVTSAVGFIVGLALFGAVTYRPLYLQDVKGHSPTTSGLLITPMMAGLLITSIGSGQPISRFGRYKPFPIAGTAIMAVGLPLLSRLEVDTSTLVTGAYMLVLGLGLGLGLVIQVLVLATQNAVDYKYLGVASSGSTLFRQIGGSIGVAIFGAIFANQLARNLAPNLGEGFQAARDDDGLREIERALSLLAGREERWDLYQRLAVRAGVDLAPPELWLLARLGERAPVTEPQLAERLEAAGPIGGALEQLRLRSLVDTPEDGTITLTTAGHDDYERLVAARCAGLRELLAGWKPDQQSELLRLVDRLGRDLVSEIPTPVATT